MSDNENFRFQNKMIYNRFVLKARRWTAVGGLVVVF